MLQNQVKKSPKTKQNNKQTRIIKTKKVILFENILFGLAKISYQGLKLEVPNRILHLEI